MDLVSHPSLAGGVLGHHLADLGSNRLAPVRDPLHPSDHPLEKDIKVPSVRTRMKGLLLLSGGFDSPVAGLLLKGKMDLEAVHFSFEPLTSGEPEEKSRTLAKQMGIERFFAINIAKEIQAIATKCERRYYFILMKRLMYRLAASLATERGCEVLVTGESVGQVSSQTLENLRTIDEAIEMPVLRPLIAMDKQEIIERAKAARTFEISKGKEMCDVLGPDKPSTQAKPHQIQHQEAILEKALKAQ